jgi:hypothetical protein
VTTLSGSGEAADALPRMTASPRRSWLVLPFVAGLWVAGVALGMKALLDHEGGQGVAATAPLRWPAGASIARDPARPTLIMLAHPRCPCTRASISELAIGMSKLGGRVAAHVFFTVPVAAGQDWERTDQWNSASRIPGVSVHVDPGGREAARFGAKTSGQVVLYGTDGRLLFSGGITPGRGHMGDNVGLDRVVSLLRSGDADRTSSAVFGCALFDEAT